MLQGRAAGISSFLQKPINTNELIDTMMILCQQKVGTIAVYRESYVVPFAKAMQQSLFQLLGVDCEPRIDLDETGFLEVDGVAVIVGLTGYPLGRLIVYMDKEAMDSRFHYEGKGQWGLTEWNPPEVKRSHSTSRSGSTAASSSKTVRRREKLLEGIQEES